MGDRRGVYRVLVGKPERKRPLGRTWHRWRIILTWNFRKWDGERMDWIGLAKDSNRLQELVNVVMNLQIP
jgi:hypothetical protein